MNKFIKMNEYRDAIALFFVMTNHYFHIIFILYNSDESEMQLEKLDTLFIILK